MRNLVASHMSYVCMCAHVCVHVCASTTRLCVCMCSCVSIKLYDAETIDEILPTSSGSHRIIYFSK